jgi:hypothetical protein
MEIEGVPEVCVPGKPVAPPTQKQLQEYLEQGDDDEEDEDEEDSGEW